MFPGHLHTLWARLGNANDLVAWSVFAGAVLEPLLADLRSKFPRVDPHLHQHAVNETIVGLLHRPEQYDPQRGSLEQFLRMSARADLKNALQRERKHSPKLRVFVECDTFARNDPSEDERPRLNDRPELQAVREKLNPRDRKFLELMLNGADDHELIDFLGLADSPPKEQRRGVKQAKDRIKAKFRRASKKP
jgi:DNA-directed RNA polymerase specialized sigma24 family protein